jgi:hypothetical protein
MNLKVIKPIKGLVEGDILYYNQEQDQYEITKIDEEVSDNKTSKKTLKVIIGAWLVDDNKEFFKYVDDDGNDMTLEEFKYEQKEEDRIVDSNSGELESLRKENEELKKSIEILQKPFSAYAPYNQPIEVYYTTNPFRHVW